MGRPGEPVPAKKPSANAANPADDGGRRVRQRLGLLRADAQSYYERGLQAFAAKNYDDALADLDAAIEHAPGYAELYTARGWIGLEAGKTKGAAEDFSYALTLNRRDWFAQYGLGVLAYNRKGWADAIDAFTKAQAIAPGQPEVWFHRGAAYYESGDQAKALADMQMALRWFKAGDPRRADTLKWIKALGGKPPADPKPVQPKPASGSSGQPTRAAEAKSVPKARPALEGGQQPALPGGQKSIVPQKPIAPTVVKPPPGTPSDE